MKVLDALAFSSTLLPHSQEQKCLQDNLRANCVSRETTRLRTTVASSARELSLYETHIGVLQSAEEIHLSRLLPSINESSGLPRPSDELLLVSAALKRLRIEQIALSKYTSLCSSATAPVRRLPPEILIHIFLLCAPVDAGWELNSKDYAGEINRLIRRDLLRLAQVCAHWRAQALGTAIFWRILHVDLMFWSHKMLPLVQTVLDRSASAPLQVRIGAPDATAVDRSLLELVAQHCNRWETAMFSMDFNSTLMSQTLSVIRGNLPLLQTLHITGAAAAHDPEQMARTMALFADAPRLVDVTYTGPAKALQNLPWRQLKRFEYLDVHSSELSDALSILPRLPSNLQFELRRLWFPSGIRAPQSSDPFPPIVKSNLKDLVIELDSPSSSGLPEVLSRLTLPSIESLEVVSLYYPKSPILWDLSAFTRFCARSRCGGTLTSLYLLHAALTPPDLLATLSELPAVEVLVVADHQAVPAVAEHVALTDEVFRRLVWQEDADTHPLLPKLAIFGCLSLLRFDEALYLNFVQSRLRLRRRQGQQFETHVRWHPGAARDLKPAVRAELRRLGKGDGLVESIDVATEVEMQTFFY
ncbi:hypothetical protein C8R43DRAFT_1129598 [Mycena crocata]|nr:hypothetical protein C8R43DRAFT_1129598 [Mycena crocata]